MTASHDRQTSGRHRIIGRWLAAEDDRLLADRLCVADSFWRRLIGLQFARDMPAADALWLRNCRSVHTACMRFPIHIFFLDKDFCIVEIRREVPPWRFVIPKSRHARHVIEARQLPASDSMRPGTKTRIETSAMDGEG